MGFYVLGERRGENGRREYWRKNRMIREKRGNMIVCLEERDKGVEGEVIDGIILKIKEGEGEEEGRKREGED
jgi:hypothetical protein